LCAGTGESFVSRNNHFQFLLNVLGAGAGISMINLDLKQQFIGRARALSKAPEVFRSTLMTALIAESVGLGVPAEAEYFAAAYGDPAGGDYWNAHLSEPVRVGAFAYLLSVHLPLKPEQLEPAKIAITLALRDAAAAGERLFVGDVTPLLSFETPKRDFNILTNVKVRPRAAVDWLLSKPRREHLVSSSLRNFVDSRSAASTRPRRLTAKGADRFAAEYIEKEKKAGRRPTLKDIEVAAKEANFRGGRQFLRDAFHRAPGVVVKEGRPSKFAN
jgi:hypothetical protein